MHALYSGPFKYLRAPGFWSSALAVRGSHVWHSVSAGELGRPKDPVMQHGKLERIADFSQQQLGSMENVCNTFLAQVASINSQLAEKASMVAALHREV